MTRAASIVPLKRFNLNMQEELFNRMAEVAAMRGVTIADLTRRYLRIGLMIDQAQRDTMEAEIIVRVDGREQRILLI